MIELNFFIDFTNNDYTIKINNIRIYKHSVPIYMYEQVKKKLNIILITEYINDDFSISVIVKNNTNIKNWENKLKQKAFLEIKRRMDLYEKKILLLKKHNNNILNKYFKNQIRNLKLKKLI